MWDLFQNMSEDIHHVYRENGEGDEELTKYVTINLPRCLISYFSSKMVISFIKIPVRNIPLSHLSLSFMSHPSFIVLSLYLTYHSILWCIMMYYDVLWCIMMYYDVYDVLWCVMMHYDALWCIMMYYDVLWCIMMYYDVYDVLWCVMMHYDALWCIMMYYDVLWCIMMYYDELWCIMIIYLIFFRVIKRFFVSC